MKSLTNNFIYRLDVSKMPWYNWTQFSLHLKRLDVKFALTYTNAPLHREAAKDNTLHLDCYFKEPGKGPWYIPLHSFSVPTLSGMLALLGYRRTYKLKSLKTAK